MPEVDGFYLTRAEQIQLAGQLREVPELAVLLALAIAKLGATEHEPGQQLKKPSEYAAIDVSAYVARDRLHNELGTTVRAVCEQRGLTTEVGDDLCSLAHWLRRHVIALALTEGAREMVYGTKPQSKDDEVVGIHRALRKAWACAAPRPPCDDRPDNLDELRHELHNAAAIAEKAQRLGGEMYRNLTEKRIHNLAKNGHITRYPPPPLLDERYSVLRKDRNLYQLGQVLDAHLLVPVRKRDTSTAGA